MQTERLAGRNDWMNSLTIMLSQMGLNRWRLSNEKLTWDQVFEANPQLRKPDNFLPYNLENDPYELPEVPK